MAYLSKKRVSLLLLPNTNSADVLYVLHAVYLYLYTYKTPHIRHKYVGYVRMLNAFGKHF